MKFHRRGRGRKKVSALWAALMVLLGVYALLRPENSLTLLCFLIGFLLSMLGVWQVFRSLKKPGCKPILPFFGTLAVAAGVVFAFRPASAVSLLAVAAGLFVLVLALLRLRTAMQCRPRGRGKPWLICGAVLCGILGAVLVFCPFSGTAVLMRVFGLGMILTGAEEFLTALLLAH